MGSSGRGVVGILDFFALAAIHLAGMERDVGRGGLLSGLESVNVRVRRRRRVRMDVVDGRVWRRVREWLLLLLGEMRRLLL